MTLDANRTWFYCEPKRERSSPFPSLETPINKLWLPAFYSSKHFCLTKKLIQIMIKE
jgi:hypothetical protein